MENLFLILFGLCLGSFLNVCIYRIPKGKSIINPPSSCVNCGKRIVGIYLVPILGYIISGCKCFNCKTKISLRYPIMEITSAIIALIIYHTSGSIIETIYLYNFFMVLLAITIIDLEEMIIPDEFIIYLLVCGVLYHLYTLNFANFLPALGIGMVFFLIAVVSKGGMGGGDVKYSFIMGLYLGLVNGILATFLAFFIGGIVGIVLLLKGDSKKKAIPFAPFLVLGTVIAHFWGTEIIMIYLNWVL